MTSWKKLNSDFLLIILILSDKQKHPDDRKSGGEKQKQILEKGGVRQ